MNCRHAPLIFLLTVLGSTRTVAAAEMVPPPAVEKLDERLVRSTATPSIAVTPRERPMPTFAVPAAAKKIATPVVLRSPELLDRDLTKLLSEAFRFNRGARLSAGFARQRTVVSRELGVHDETTAVLYQRLLEILEIEEAGLEEFVADATRPALPAFKETTGFLPTLRVELLGSRPLVAELDFRARRAIVLFDGRWTSRALPEDALVKLLPAVGADIYAFLTAESDGRRLGVAP